MAATTTLLGLVTPTQGTLSGTWGDTVNYGISDYVDISVAGTLTLTNDGAVTLANTTGSSSGNNITSTLTGAGTVTAQFAIVRVTGTLTVAKVVTGPSYSKTYTVVNAATGGIVTFKASGQTGVSVAVGESAFVYFNGTDYVKLVGTATAGAAGGSNTQVQYNNSGVLAGITGATTNGTALTLVAPILGTPASATLTNATGLPISTGVSGLGTGIATALAVNTGSAGAPVLFNGALGTPSSGTVTNLTGTASININGTVGATTATTGAFTTVSATSTGTFAGVLSRTHAQGTNAYLTVETLGKANTVMGFNDSGVTAGGAPTANSYFGTLQNYQLAFISNNALLNTSAYTFHTWNISAAESMRLNATGLGIGTSSPANKLQVEVSSADVEAVLFNNTYTVASARTALRMGYQVAGYGVRIVSEGNAGAVYSNSLVFERGIGSSSYSETMRITSTGDVGIGTSSPVSKLEIQAAGGPTLTLTSSTTAGSTNKLVFKTGFSGTNGDQNIAGINAELRISGSTVGGVNAFTTFYTDSTERLRIASTGAFGLSGANYGTNGQVLTSGGSGAAPTWTTAGGGSQWTTTGSDIYYNTGKVGIGTTTVTTKLDVRNGATNATNINTTSDQISITHNSNNGVGGQAVPAGFVVVRDKASAVSSGEFLGGLSWNARYTDTEDRAGYASILAVATGSGTADITFNTSSTNITTAERLRLNGNGALILSGGTVTADGVGITFPATQSASTNANTLDDYEEGTWTPAFAFGGGTTGMTYSVQSGKYIKVGNSVACTGRIVFTNKGSSTGNATITGLPFTTGSGDASFSAASLLPDAVTYTGGMFAISALSSTSISVYSVTEAGTPTQLTNSNYSNSSQTIITLTYLI